LWEEVVSFIRPTDVAGKNRKAFRHTKPFPGWVLLALNCLITDWYYEDIKGVS